MVLKQKTYQMDVPLKTVEFSKGTIRPISSILLELKFGVIVT